MNSIRLRFFSMCWIEPTSSSRLRSSSMCTTEAKTSLCVGHFSMYSYLTKRKSFIPLLYSSMCSTEPTSSIRLPYSSMCSSEPTSYIRLHFSSMCSIEPTISIRLRYSSLCSIDPTGSIRLRHSYLYEHIKCQCFPKLKWIHRKQEKITSNRPSKRYDICALSAPCFNLSLISGKRNANNAANCECLLYILSFISYKAACATQTIMATPKIRPPLLEGRCLVLEWHSLWELKVSLYVIVLSSSTPLSFC